MVWRVPELTYHIPAGTQVDIKSGLSGFRQCAHLEPVKPDKSSKDIRNEQVLYSQGYTL